jgi:hypothetical protein
MVGYCGKHPEKQSYQTREYINSPRSGTVLGRIVPGVQMHDAVLACLKDAVASKANLQESMLKAVKHVTREQSGDNRETLERELIAVRAQQVRLNRNRSGDERLDRDVDQELDLLDEKARKLNEILARKPRVRMKASPEAVATQLTKEFIKLGGDIDNMDFATKKAMLKCLIQRMTIDLETREIELNFALPKDLHGLFLASSKGTLVARLQTLGRHYGPPDFQPILGCYRLTYDWSRRIYTWKRRKAA